MSTGNCQLLTAKGKKKRRATNPTEGIVISTGGFVISTSGIVIPTGGFSISTGVMAIQPVVFSSASFFPHPHREKHKSTDYTD